MGIDPETSTNDMERSESLALTLHYSLSEIKHNQWRRWKTVTGNG
jgi:hypothetical protein